MIQRILFFGICWGGFFLSAKAQIEEYYRPYKRPKTAILLTQPDLVRSNSHWYVGIEGGGKWNGATLSNSLFGLLAYRSGYTDSYAGGHLGYSHNLRWSIESGYIRNPSNTIMRVNAFRGFTVRVNELEHSIPLRFKWRILRLGNVLKQSGIYVGAGILWTPTRKRQDAETFLLTGLTRSSGAGNAPDTLLVENQTFSTGKSKLEPEVSLEFVGRVSTHLEIVAFGRVHYAGASALRSDSQLYINRLIESTSSLTLRPVSYQFGVAIRYIYGMRNLYRSRFED